MRPDIFLSYNREDRATAQRFAESFEAQGFSVWWDVTLRSGEAYDKVTEEALRSAKAVVVLWSKKSAVSRWVRAEAAVADRNGTLVPVRIEPCDLPVMFELTQTADLAQWKGEESDPVWRAFLKDVRRMVGVKAVPITDAHTPPVSGSPARGQRPVLAILPFLCRSEHVEDEDFAEDLAEDLTRALSFSPWMEVVAASKTATYRNGARDLCQIGRDLSAFYLLEGKIRRVGDCLRITAQLLAAEEGKVLWSQKFDRPLDELVESPEDLVTEIAVALGTQVERSEQDYALRKTGNITPWEGFLRAVAFQGRGTRVGFESALAEARRALDADPEFAYAYAVMLAAQSPLVIYRDDTHELASEIVENIRRVRALKPDDPTVLVGCATGLNALRRPQEALPFAERAVSINPNIDFVRMCLGVTLINLGRVDQGLVELDAGDRISANIIRDHLNAVMRAAAYLHTGRLDQALAAAENAVRRLVCAESLMECALCREIAGNGSGARDAMRQISDLDPEIKRRHIENLVRYFHFSSREVDQYVAIICRLWDEIGGKV